MHRGQIRQLHAGGSDSLDRVAASRNVGLGHPTAMREKALRDLRQETEPTQRNLAVKNSQDQVAAFVTPPEHLRN